MKKTWFAAMFGILLLGAVETKAQDRPFGLGILLGEPTGISAKLWVAPTNAFDFGLGWSYGGDRINHYSGVYNGGDRVHFHMDYLWHWFNAIHAAERFPLYTGLGGRLNTGAGYTSSVAVRGVFGIAWLPRQAPIDLFLEMVPSLQVLPAVGFGIDAGIGIRYFF